MAHEPRTRIGVDLPPELYARLRAAYFASPRSVAASFSEFIVTAVLAHVSHLETVHNGGKPWPHVAAGALPRRRGPAGDKKERTMPRLTESEAGRIRGAAMALDLAVTELCEAAIRERFGDLPPTAAPAPARFASGRPL